MLQHATSTIYWTTFVHVHIKIQRVPHWRKQPYVNPTSIFESEVPALCDFEQCGRVPMSLGTEVEQ